MKHLFIPYPLAVLAKEKGFDEECVTFFNSEGKLNMALVQVGLELPLSNSQMSKNRIAAPLYQQIVDWFREEHDLDINIIRWVPNKSFYFKIQDGLKSVKSHSYDEFTYYEALNKAIEEAFKLI